MKVILLTAVKSLGSAGDVKNVADGYATNFLFPKRLAEAATGAAIARVERAKKERAAAEKTQADTQQKLAGSLSGMIVVIRAKAKDGKLFGSVGSREIAEALSRQGHEGVMEKHVVLPRPIKEIGSFPVEAHFDSRKAKFTVSIEAMGKERG
jgi:large subunit ribosomal protein L9